MEKTSDYSELLRQLVHLQEYHSRISELQGKVEHAPAQIAELDAVLEGETSEVSSAQQRIEDATKERKALEHEVEALRGKLAHYKDQLMSVKTNSAYQAMLHEIGFVENQIAEKEDRILERMLETDELESNLSSAKGNFEEKRRSIERQKKEIQDFVTNSERELEQLRTEMGQLENSLPAGFLERYRRIAAVRGGIALAAVSNSSCEACHVRLRPQLVAEIRTNREIIVCENCNRILYYPYTN